MRVQSYRDFLPQPVANTFAFDPADKDEVISIICKLNKGKATGPFSILSEILQKTKDALSYPLTKIINLSFTSGIHPSNLQISKTIPIFKKDSPLTLCNYRPISLLSNINKISKNLSLLTGFMVFSKNTSASMNINTVLGKNILLIMPLSVSLIRYARPWIKTFLQLGCS